MSASAIPERAGAPRLPPRTDFAFLFTGLGLFFLFVTVWVGVAGQVGVQNCAVCSGDYCTGSQVCPESVTALVSTAIVLAIEAFFVSVGLSSRALANAVGSPVEESESVLPSGWRLAIHVAAPFLMFWGWALVALGLILPFGFFQLCHEACGYPNSPWILTGYPLATVEIGGAILSAGIGMLGVVAFQLHRSTQRRVREGSVGQLGQGGPN